MRSDVPERYRNQTLDSFDPVTPTAARALAEAWRVAGGQLASLALIGKPGVGKTHLAAGIVHSVTATSTADWQARHDAAIAEYRTITPLRMPEWCNVPELVTDLRAEMGTEQHAATDRARRLRSWPALLVLDDLGREKISDWTGELIYTLVNARYEAMLPTVATSNLSPAELVANGYWPAISRLAEDGALVEIKAPDHRLARDPMPLATAKARP